MNFAYIDKKNKSKILFFRPEEISFPTGHTLIILPDLKKESKIKKVLKSHSATLIPPTPSKSFSDKIKLKTIKQAAKQISMPKIVFQFENALDYIQLLRDAICENLDFYILSGPGVVEVNDLILEKTGIPLKAATSLSHSLMVHFGGEIPQNPPPENILNLSDSKIPGCYGATEFMVKNADFPLKINTIPLLETALFLMEKDISDVIVKFGIFNKNEE